MGTLLNDILKRIEEKQKTNETMAESLEARDLFGEAIEGKVGLPDPDNKNKNVAREGHKDQTTGSAYLRH
jgi:hypothetical protein